MRLPIMDNSLVTFELVYVNEKLNDIGVKYSLNKDIFSIKDTFSIPEFLDVLNNHKIYEGGQYLSNKSKFASIFNNDKNIYMMIIAPTVVPIPVAVFVIANTVDDAINVVNSWYYCRHVITCSKVNINDISNMKGE